ncbi:MAG: tripartite tricarboxylate transporter substrate binding protein [Betaproteobacteria bacterium]|nr:tripartite tricarboxylate transporter substrate binding protein [Betaproteobacteria bacterium]
MKYPSLVVCFVLVALLGMGSSSVVAQKSAYPTKPIRWIVSYAPGTTGDILARALSPRVSESFGQQVVVDNRGGANGNLGTAAGAKSSADGYTFLLAGNASLSINPHVTPNLPYHPVKDFAPVILLGTVPLVLNAHPALPAKSVRELVLLAKTKPGHLNYASGGNGTTTHLAGELLKMSAGIELTHIPYRTAAQAIIDLLGGQVPLMFTAVPTTLSHVRAGLLRAIAVTGAKRAPALPEVPALAETLPGFEVTVWYGLLAPAGTAKDIVQRNFTEVTRTLQTPEVRQQLGAQGVELSGMGPERFAAFVKEEFTRWGKVVKAAGARPD